jgi:endonuclease YncB( thermonuclease family)
MNPYFYKFRLGRIIDGDTFAGSIDLGFQLQFSATIRLHAVNAPELHTKRGVAALEFVKSFFAGPDDYVLQSITRDDFGRCVARLWRRGDVQSLNERLIDAGVAAEVKGGK